MNPKPNTDGLAFFIINERTGNTVGTFMFYEDACRFMQDYANRNHHAQLVMTDPDGDPI